MRFDERRKPMNELKPEDVMKALEEWIYDFKGTVTQFCTLCDAIALLREKDAEIERLREDAELCRHTIANLSNMVDTARDAGITECAERVKTFYRNLRGKTIGGSVEYHIEQIANELRGKRR
jgi:hypothetical protein